MKEHPITTLVSDATAAVRRSVVLRWGLLGIGMLLIAATVAVIADGAIALPPLALLAVDLLLVIALVALPFVVGARLRRVRTDPRHVARVLEARTGAGHNELINALELSTELARAGGSVSRELVGRTVEEGDRLAPRIDARIVVDRARTRRAALMVLCVPVAALLIHLAVPNLFPMVLRRFADPFGFHPPFTALSFDVEIEPGAVHYGKPAVIRAGVHGALRAESAEIVFVDDADPHRELDVVPMLPDARSDDALDGERFTLRIERATESRSFVVRTPRGRSGLQRLDVRPVPAFEHVSVTLTPPAYTRWPATDRPFAGEIATLKGTRIALSVSSSLPLREATLVFTATDGAREEVTLAPDGKDPRVARGSILADASGRMEIGLTGADGTPGDARRAATLVVTDDAAPRVSILEPDEHAVVVEGWALDVVFEAEDDVGIERMEVLRSVNGFPPVSAAMEPAGGDRTRTLARAHFDTSDLGARPGDLIRCNALVWDGYESPPHSARSPIVTIEVISADDYAQMMRDETALSELTAQAEAFEKELERLAAERDALLEQLDAAERAEAAGQESSEARDELAKRLDEYRAAAESLADRMEERAGKPPVYDAESAWQEALRRQAEGLRGQEQVAEVLSDASRAQPNPGRDSERADAGERFREESDPFGEEARAAAAETARDLERLAAAESLLEHAEAVRQAILDQRALADEMAQFRQKPSLSPQDQLRLHDLAQEQDALRERLDAAREALRDAAVNARERLPNMSAAAEQICDMVGESGAMQDQVAAAEAGAAGLGRDAHDAADSAATKLEGLLSECNAENMMPSMENDLDGCLKLPKPSLRQALRQMANARLGRMSRLGMGSRGGMGAGFSGMMSSASIYGPHRPNGRSSRETRQVGDDAHSKAATDGALSRSRADGAERIEASTSRSTSGSGALLGVPAPFRGEAAAYFRRLGEDANPRDESASGKGGTP